MDTHEVINVCRGRRRYWRERFLELNSQQSELLARQLRLKALPRAAMHRLDDASDEIERILEKFTRQRR